MCGYFGKIVQKRFFWPDDTVAEIWIPRNGHPSEDEGENSNVWKEGRGDQVLLYKLRWSVWIFIVSAVRCHWRILNVVSKITADGDSSHEIKRHLLLERKAMTNLDSYYKAETLLCGQRSIHIVKPLVFRVVVYGCESWTVKSVEHWITDSFELWCWRRLLRVPLTGRRSNQATLKKINLEYSLEELMLKLKLPMLWPPDAQSWFIRKDPDAGKDWRQKEKEMTEDKMVGWHHQLDGHEF